MQRMAEVMADVDMYITSSGDVGLTNQTGHPAVVVQTGWGAAGGPGGGGGRAGGAGRAGGGGDPVATPTPTPTPAAPAPQQPTVTTIVGALFNDDKILSVAHAFQIATDWHTRRPKI